MSPHHEVEVGIRELNSQLSRYVKHAAEGGEVIVTMRGKAVARLGPIEREDPLADLRARGLVQEPTGTWEPTWRAQPATDVPISDFVAEQRR